MREHTPGPWETSKIGNNYDQHMVYGEDGSNVCNTVYSKANAEFIVKACNGYEELRRLLEDLWDKTSDYLFVNSGDYYEYKARIEAIRKAAR